MKVNYNQISVEQVVEYLKENPKRDDLYFETKEAKNPTTVKNLQNYVLQFADAFHMNWYQRVVINGTETKDGRLDYFV